MSPTPAAILLLATACLASPQPPATLPTTRPVTRVGQIAHPAITESSGLAASRQFPGVFWTHTDSGGPPLLCAIDATGKTLAEVLVDAPNEDWEDLAIDDRNRLYIADTGNNGATRKTVTVYRLEEPDPRKRPGRQRLRPTSAWRLTYPAAPFDCEALFVWRDWGYLISKEFTGRRAQLYRFSLQPADKPVVMEYVGELPLRSPVTAADVSPDGNDLAVLTVLGLNRFRIEGEVRNATRREPVSYVRLVQPQIEACCFTPDGVLVSNEQRQLYLIRPSAQPRESGATPKQAR